MGMNHSETILFRLVCASDCSWIDVNTAAIPHAEKKNEIITTLRCSWSQSVGLREKRGANSVTRGNVLHFPSDGERKKAVLYLHACKRDREHCRLVCSARTGPVAQTRQLHNSAVGGEKKKTLLVS